MIEITVNRDGTVSTPSGNVFLGNKFENLDETLSFTFPEEFQEYNKYLIGYHKRRKATVILPINDDIFYVTTGLTYLDGDWTLYAMCRQQILDLSTDEEVDISPKEGEHVFISDGFSATVASNNIDSSVINSTVLDQNLKPIYEELLKTKNDVQEIIESQQAILIDLPMDGAATLSNVDVPEDEVVPLSKVYIDRKHFLNEDGTPKQFVKVNITVGGVPSPYYIDCVNASGVGDQLEYLGATVTDPMTIDLLQSSRIIGLDIIEVVGDFPEADGNHFDVNISFRYSLVGSFKYLGLVRSAVPLGASAGYTVPAAINEFGEIYVPTYPEIPDNSYNDVFWVNIVPVEGQPGKIKVDKTKTEIGLAIQSNKKALLMDEKGEVFFFAEIGPTQSRPDDIAYRFTSYAELYQAGGIYLLQNQINVYDQDDVEHEILEVLASSYNYGLITRQDDTFTCDLTFIELAQSSQSAVYYTPDGGETCVYNRCRMSDQSETMTFQHMLTTETGIKISEFTISSDNTVTYSEKEFTSN